MTEATRNEMLEIEIIGKHIEGEKDGKKYSFYSYRAVRSGGSLMDCRFTKEVKNAPEVEGSVTIVVNENNCNIATNRKYPTLWITKIEEVKETVRKSNVRNYF